jgi:hypothetical protein
MSDECEENIAINWIDAIKAVSGNGITSIDASKYLKKYWKYGKKVLKLSDEDRFNYAVENAKKDAENLRNYRSPNRVHLRRSCTNSDYITISVNQDNKNTNLPKQLILPKSLYKKYFKQS